MLALATTALHEFAGANLSCRVSAGRRSQMTLLRCMVSTDDFQLP